MKAIFYTFAAIALIAILTWSSFQNYKISASFFSAFKGLASELNEQKNENQVAAFQRNIKKSKEEEKPTTVKFIKKSERHRVPNPALNQDKGKINIIPVLTTGKTHVYYEPIARMIRYLWKDLLEEGAEYQLLDALILQCKNPDQLKRVQSIDSLGAVDLNDNDLQNLLYFILQGKDSVLPLGFYVKASSDKHKVCFHRASNEVRLALTNNLQFVQAINQEEERISQEEQQGKRKSSLKKEEIQVIAEDNNLDMRSLQALFDFSL